MTGLQRILRTSNRDALYWSAAFGLLFALIAAVVFLCGGQPWVGLEFLDALCWAVVGQQVHAFGHPAKKPAERPTQERIP